MSVWIELRCEHSAEDHAEKGGDSVCWSHRNQGCGEMSSPQPEAIMETYKEVEQNALKAGWKKVYGEWVCPHCIKEMVRK